MLKLCKICDLEKDLYNFSSRKGTKDGLLTSCKQCVKEYNAKYRRENAEKIKQYAKSMVGFYRDSRKKYHKIYRSEHVDQVTIQKNLWYKNNIAKSKIKSKKWSSNNRDKCNATRAKRRAAMKNALPLWLTKIQIIEISEFFTKAKLLNVETGIVHHVDHIIPLQNKLVCGLHVPWNLQLLTPSENSSKKNKFDGTYGNESWRANFSL